jgi:Plant transposon protein
VQRMFASAQEGKRKDIERAFGILQARFHILTTPSCLWDRGAMDTVIRTCVILHNMIIDYEAVHGIDRDYIDDEDYVPLNPFVVIPRDPGQNGNHRAEMIVGMQDHEQHICLQHDLMAHMWQTWFAANHDDDNDDDDNEEMDMEL